MSRFQPWEMRLVRALSDPLPATERPFAAIAEETGVSEEQVLQRVRAWLEDGTIRRFGARVDHHAAGYPANGMSAWKAPADQIEAAGQFMAEQPEVSHCYWRDTAPGWDYNLYAMIHGATPEEVVAVAQRIAANTGLRDYEVLYSVRELKKSAPRYFAETEHE
jgi:DNA-binding Lrp family transcriptional regulator